MKINLRKEYSLLQLNLKDLNHDPLEQLAKWVKEAVEYNVIEPNAMVLATADLLGRPTTRVMLLKEIDTQGLIFYTNYKSRKAQELFVNPYASVTLYWKEFERQASFFGKIVKMPKKRALLYFQTRPRASQISAWASKQEAEAESRKEIEQAYTMQEKRWKGMDVPMPPNWGGFILIPNEAIFWQGREKRLHDRFHYQKTDKKWTLRRLYP